MHFNRDYQDSNRIRHDLIITSAVAVVACIFLSWQILSLTQQEIGQFDKYPNAAIQYLNGTIAPERILDYSPLYLGLNIAAFRFLEYPIQSLLLIQIAFLSAATTLLYLILRRYFSILLSTTGVAAFMLSKSIIIYGYVLEPEPLMIFFLAAIVFFGGRSGATSHFLTGLSLTMSLLTRPSFVVLVILIPLLYRLRSGSFRKAAPAIVAFLIPVAIGSTIITVRNYQLQGNLSLAVMNPGTLLYYGNNPQSDGTAVLYPPVINDMAGAFREESDYHHAVVRLVSRRIAGNSIISAEDTNRMLLQSTINYIKDHPYRFFVLTAERLFYIFNGYRWHDLDVSWSAEQILNKRRAPFVPFALVSAMALTGIIICMRSYRDYFLMYAIVLSQTSLMAITLTTDRQRVCIYSFLVFFAVAVLDKAIYFSKIRYLLIVSVLPLMLIFSYRTGLMKDNRHTQNSAVTVPVLLKEAESYNRNLDVKSAIIKYSQALALGPWAFQNGKPADLPITKKELYNNAISELSSMSEYMPSVQFDRALLLIEAERYYEADEILVLLAHNNSIFSTDNDRHPEPLYHLGRIAMLRGDRTKALAYLQQALKKLPGDPAVLAQLSCMTGDNNYDKLLFRYFDEIDASFFLGQACVENGQYSRAVEYLDRMSALLPEHPRGQILLAAALGGIGKYSEAAELYIATTGGRSGTVMLEDMIVPIFKRWAHDNRPETLYWCGVVLRQYGRFSEALHYFRQAEKSGYSKASEEIKFLNNILERTSLN